MFFYYFFFIILGLLGSLPHTLLTHSVQAWIAVSGGTVLYSGLTTLVGLPFAFRFFWAYAADYIRLKYGFDYHHTLILSAITLVLMLFWLSFFDPILDYQHFFFWLLLGCVLSATVDTILDGLRIIITPKQRQSALTATYSAAYRVGFFITNGLGFVLADRFGWHSFFQTMAVILFSIALLVYFFIEFTDFSVSIQQQRTQIGAADTSLVISKYISSYKGVLILIAVLKWHEILLGSLMQPFLIQGLDLSLDQVGVWLNIYGTIANIIGSMVAGYCMDFYCRKSAVQSFVAMQLLASVGFYIMALGYVQPLLINTVIFIEKFADGLMNTTIMMIILHYCSKQRAATENAFILSITSTCRAMVGPFAVGVHTIGGHWYGFFLMSATMLLPIFFLLTKKDWDDFFTYNPRLDSLGNNFT